jgi:hypothetical protein
LSLAPAFQSGLTASICYTRDLARAVCDMQASGTPEDRQAERRTNNGDQRNFTLLTNDDADRITQKIAL